MALTDVLDAITTELRRIGDIVRGIRGAGVTNGPGGIVINPPVGGSDTPDPQRHLVWPAKMTGPDTGNGFYKGRTCFGPPTVTNAALALSMPMGMGVADTDNLLIVVPSESGVGGHPLMPSSNSAAIFGNVLLVGSTREDPPRMIAEWLGSSPAVGYLKVSADWSSSINNGNYITGHPCSADGSNPGTSTVNINLVSPGTGTNSKLQFSPLKTDDVVAYVPTGTTTAGSNVMGGIALPTRQLPLCVSNRTYLTGNFSGTVCTLGFDYVRGVSL